MTIDDYGCTKQHAILSVCLREKSCSVGTRNGSLKHFSRHQDKLLTKKK